MHAVKAMRKGLLSQMHVVSATEHVVVGIALARQGVAHAGSWDCAREPGIYRDKYERASNASKGAEAAGLKVSILRVRVSSCSGEDQHLWAIYRYDVQRGSVP